MQRQQQLTEWLQRLFPGRAFTIAPASADASFRRYFRATFADDDSTLIVMDAPPQHEDCHPFLHVGKLLEDAGAHVPHVHAQDLAQGFLLLSDLGNTTYLQVLDSRTAPALYSDATEALIRIQLASREHELPPYDEALLLREMRLFPEWYVTRHLNVALSEEQHATLEAMFARIVTNNLAQPRVYVHRDYHSRNLMITDPNPGIIDFQDAVYGPITYDLVSLFRDAYIRWEEAEILDWLIRYWEKARAAGLPVRADFSEFYRDFEWMGVQRHLKVLGIFARLYHRDGKDGYLKDLPLVMNYLRAACARYIDLKPLLKLLNQLEPQDIREGYTF